MVKFLKEFDQVWEDYFPGSNQDETQTEDKQITGKSGSFLVKNVFFSTKGGNVIKLTNNDNNKLLCHSTTFNEIKNGYCIYQKPGQVVMYHICSINAEKSSDFACTYSYCTKNSAFKNYMFESSLI